MTRKTEFKLVPAGGMPAICLRSGDDRLPRELGVEQRGRRNQLEGALCDLCVGRWQAHKLWTARGSEATEDVDNVLDPNVSSPKKFSARLHSAL